MNIGIDIRLISIHRGGPVRYTINIIKNIASLSNNNSLFLYNFTRSSEVWDGRYNNVKEKIIRLPQRFKLTKHLWEDYLFPLNIRKNNIDVIFSPVEYISNRIKIPRVIVIHDVMWLTYQPILPMQSTLYLKDRIMKSLKNISHIITVSEFSKNGIVNNMKIDNKKISVIYEGVEEIFHPINNKEKIESVLNFLGISGEYILFVGGTNQWKNIDGLINVFVEFRDKNTISKVKLVIVGLKGINLKYFLELIPLRYKNDVIFTGFVDNTVLPFVYCGAKCFITLSYFEGFGLPPLEAIACGIPVIASNRAAIPEICGDSALYVDPDNIDQIVESLKQVLEDNLLRDKMISKGLHWASRYSWKKAAEETLEILTGVFAKSF